MKYISQVEAWEDPGQVDYIHRDALRLYKKPLEELSAPQIKSVLNMRYGAINQFRPNIARFIINMFNPRTVMDSCAGWGGRCLGAMSLDKNYIGIDTNVELMYDYSDMVKMYPSDSSVTIINKDALNINYEEHIYDLFFTSPPYSNKEKYLGMPIYPDFIKDWLLPLVKKTYAGLQPRGNYCLNIPHDHFLAVQEVLGSPTNIIHIKKNYRPNCNNHEKIYHWYKN